jgi:hypothetical protein
VVELEHILSRSQQGTSVVVVNWRVGALTLLADVHGDLGVMVRVADKLHHVISIRVSVLSHLRDLSIRSDEPWVVQGVVDLNSLTFVFVQKF